MQANILQSFFSTSEAKIGAELNFLTGFLDFA